MTASHRMNRYQNISPRAKGGMWQYLGLWSAAMRSNSVLVYAAACGCSRIQTLGTCIGWFMGVNNEPTVPTLLWGDPFSGQR